MSRQCVGSPRSQASHCPQLPSVVSTTWSPTCTLRDAGADRLDDAGALVAEHDRRRERDGAVDHRHVAVAQPGPLDAHDDLAGPGLGVAQLDVVADLELAGPHEPPHRVARPFRWGASTWPGRPASGWSSPSSTIGTPLTIVALHARRASTSSGRRRWGSRGRTPSGPGRSCRGRTRTGRRRSRAARGRGRRARTARRGWR